MFPEVLMQGGDFVTLGVAFGPLVSAASVLTASLLKVHDSRGHPKSLTTPPLSGVQSLIKKWKIRDSGRPTNMSGTRKDFELSLLKYYLKY